MNSLPPLPSWIDRPMRWAQLAFVEDDPKHIDIDFWMDYFERLHVEGVCLSAGGCVAFYPTQVPLHYRSRWLGERDLFGEMVARCRAKDMAVLARTDPHAFHDDIAEAHPDWVARDAAGEARRHWAHPDYWVACTLGPYTFEMLAEATREIMQGYDVQGIFCNRWAGSGMCWCEHCRRNFREATGHELPRSGDPSDPARRAYIGWRQARLFELWRLWDSIIKQCDPDACFIPNVGGGALSELDMAEIGRLAPMLVADRQSRSGVTPPWANGKNSKEYRATLGMRPAIGLFSVGIEERYRWKDSVQSTDEMRLWVLDGIAHGLRPWFVKFCSVVHDPRWMGEVERIYKWHHEHERHLRNTASLAKVGLVYSQQTAHYYGGESARQWVGDPGMGWYHALVEARVPFEMVHDRLLGEEHLRGLKVLILPNIAALSDGQCEQLRGFVQRGGSIIATYETSLCDEWGQPRGDFGLGDLFGVSLAGSHGEHVEGPMRNAYLRLHPPHPLLEGLEDAPRIIHGVHRLRVQQSRGQKELPVTLIPAYPDLPMEEVYVREAAEDVAELFAHEHGIGRCVYFNWDIDRTFWELLTVDHGRLMANAVKWAMGDEAQPVEVVGEGVIDVAAWRQRESMTVHLVNLSNPMMMKGPVRRLLSVGSQRVRVALPEGCKARSARLLVSERAVSQEVAEGWLEVETGPIVDHEVIAIDLA